MVMQIKLVVVVKYFQDLRKSLVPQKHFVVVSQLWRALRLIVDTGLHYKGMTREKSLRLFQKYLWDNSDVAIKEVTRYQSVPGQATSYMIGQLHIMKLREYAKKKLGKEFNLKDFHFQVLFQGSAPLSFLQQSIEEYVDCTLNKNKEGCDEVLDPLFKDSQDNVSKNDEMDTIDSTQRELYF